MSIEREQVRKDVLEATVSIRGSQDLVGGHFSPTVGMSSTVQPMMTAQEMTQGLKEAGIPISSIAESMKVERKTIYVWLDGTGEARSSRVDRLRTIHRALLPAGHRDLTDLFRFWSTPVNGTSMRDLLSADALDGERIGKLAVLLSHQARQAAARRTRMATTKGPNGFLEGLERAFIV